jgi:two-component system phosphate regulon sensor histidine kinase PhoR
LSNLWVAEFWRIALIAAAGALLGLLVGHPRLFAALAVIVYFAWHLIQLRKLVLWLNDGRSFSPPEGIGIWGEVFHLINRLQQRNRKRKRQLASILNQYQKATDAMPDATVVLGRHWEIQWFNEAASALLDFKPSQDIGQRVDNLLRHPAFTAFLAAGASGTLEIAAPHDSRIALNIRVVPYGDEQRLLIARDVSEKQRLEQMRRDFIGNVSHELRTPLTVVAGFLETITDADDECTRSWKRSLDLMRQQTVRMQSLVEDLLLLSRLENDRYQLVRETVDVPAIIAAMQEDARILSAEKNHRIETQVQPGLHLWGAERELYSAFNNLITNAVRYTPAGGRITIRWYADGRGAHFAVTDTGVGIAPEHLPRVTERFYRVDPGRSRETGGTGLGLAIVKHVLQRHDARLHIESELGAGSTFAAEFPAERVVTGEAL